MNIPGLSFVPVEETQEKVECPSFSLMSFDMKEFQIPEDHKYGKCRQISEFERLSIIGEGAYGTVYKARDMETNKIVALKKIKAETELAFTPMSLTREVNSLRSLQHVNIIHLFGVAVGKNLQSTYLILEYCPYSLSKLLDEGDKNLLKHPQIKCIMLQLFSALDFIHKHCVLHRDVSPPNILFSEAGILKIADFGSSRKYASDNLSPSVGVQWYRAPELLFGSEKYTCAVDIWSAGCVFAELLRKKPLFIGDSDAALINLVIECLGTPSELVWPGYSKLPVCKHYELRYQPCCRLKDYFDAESQVAFPLLQIIFQYNPKSRPTAEKCIQQPYFTQAPDACELEELVAILKSIEKY